MRTDAAFALVVACAVIATACDSCNRPTPPPATDHEPPARIDARDAGKEVEAVEAPEPSGAIEGTIAFTGTPPRMAPLKRTADPACAQMPKTEESVLVKDGKLQNVFVRVTQNVPGVKAPTEPAVLDQRACAYHPRVLGMAWGQPLRVLNSDATLHNVHAYEGEQSTFNVPQPPGAPPLERTPTAGVIKLKCDVHPWMTAYVVVSPNKFFAVSGEDGAYRISGLPDGDYTLETWHERYKPKVAAVTVKGGVARADFSFSEADRQ